MSVMTEVVKRKGGVIDKILGDSIMAFWEPPTAGASPAPLAIECGLEMLEALGRLQNKDQRFADISMGVGVATGDAVVGNLGGKERFDYSVVGDTVNLAARLESLTRQLGVSFLINEQTLIEAGDTYVARGLGLIKVKGKTQPAEVVEIVGRQSEPLDYLYYAKFTEALTRARQGLLEQAKLQLQQVGRMRPQDIATKMYLELLGSSAGSNPKDLVLEFPSK